MEDYKNVVNKIEEIIEPIGLDNYLENFSNPQDQEIKAFLTDYANALEKTDEIIKSNALKEKINSFFNI